MTGGKLTSSSLKHLARIGESGIYHTTKTPNMTDMIP